MQTLDIMNQWMNEVEGGFRNDHSLFFLYFSLILKKKRFENVFQDLFTTQLFVFEFY